MPQDSQNNDVNPPTGSNRRSALRGLVGLGALGAASPLISSIVPSLTTPAMAQASRGVTANGGDVLFIPASAAEVVPMAEWTSKGEGADVENAAFRYAAGAENVAKAPANASRYEARTYQYPTGAFRTLTWKKGGGPVLHQITFETEIIVLKGSLTLSPLYGFPGKDVKVNAGDVLFHPAGQLHNAKPSEDTILLTAIVGNSTKGAPKGAHVTAKQATVSTTAQWEENGKEMSANKPEDLKKAPKTALTFTTARYVGDGNSVRFATFKKPGKSGSNTTSGRDVLCYIASGSMRRTEGKEVLVMKVGDTVREKMGNPGFWEVLEPNTVFIATDAPLLPGNFSPTMVSR